MIEYLIWKKPIRHSKYVIKSEILWIFPEIVKFLHKRTIDGFIS